MRALIKEEVNTQLPQILPQAVSDFTNPVIEKNITELVEVTVLTRSSSQLTSTYEVAVSLSEFELIKILINKMEKNKSYDKADYKKKLYDALVESYNTDKDLLDSYGKVFSLKRSRDDSDKDRDPSARSDQGKKRRKSSKDVVPSIDSRSKEKKSSSTFKDAFQSQHKSYGKSAHAEEPSYIVKDSGMQYPVMSSSSTVTYTSVYNDSEPGRVFWGADEELSDGGSPRVIVYGYDGLPMQPVSPPSPYYVPGPEHPPSSDYVPGPEHPPSPIEVPYVPEPEYPEYLVPADVEASLEDHPLPVDASPTTLSPGYVADSDPDKDLEEDLKEDHFDYPADRGDDDDEPSDDDDDDDDTDDEDKEPFEEEDDDEEEEEEHLALADSSAVPVIDPVPSAWDTEAFETDESAPTPRSPQTKSPPLPHIPSPPLPPPPSSLHLPPPVPISLPLLSSPLPPLPALLFIPPLVDHREDIPEAELPPRKRLCPTAPTSRYKVGEISTVAPRPTKGHRAGYGFIEDTQDRQTQLFQRVGGLVKDRQFHYETARLLDREALDYRIASQESLMTTLIAHVSSLQGQLSAALGQIQALQARDQTHADDLEDAGSSA
ncbi:hypothetical protein Tco_1315570 [Tanacetum coccineum]